MDTRPPSDDTNKTETPLQTAPPPTLADYQNYNTSSQLTNPSHSWNLFAILSLIMVWFAVPAAFVLAIIALKQIKQTGQRGAFLAWIALGLSMLVVVGVLYLFSGINGNLSF